MTNFFKSKSEKDMEGRIYQNLFVDKNRCPQNHPCPSIRVCPVAALTQKGYAAPEVDMEKCIRCGSCVKFCPKRALIFIEPEIS